jgi:hypothetical protein
MADFVTKNDPRAPCRHIYCVGCLRNLFTASLQDETLMPPRCCRQEIPVALAQLTPEEIEEFNAKRLENSTVDRLYCSQPTCSAFIPPALIVNSVGTCPKYVSVSPSKLIEIHEIIYVLDSTVELPHVLSVKRLVMTILIVPKTQRQQLFLKQLVRPAGFVAIDVEH